MIPGYTGTTPPTILVIDDDELIRLTCRNILKKMECNVIEAENGVDGLAQFKKEHPSIVITDLLMPDKEGLETISDIKRNDKTVKIIAMSGGGSTQNMSFLNIAKQMGADIILSKPFKPDELLGAIKALL
jgi:DNA-binding response OmpR family regulator